MLRQYLQRLLHGSLLHREFGLIVRGQELRFTLVDLAVRRVPAVPDRFSEISAAAVRVSWGARQLDTVSVRCGDVTLIRPPDWQVAAASGELEVTVGRDSLRTWLPAGLRRFSVVPEEGQLRVSLTRYPDHAGFILGVRVASRSSVVVRLTAVRVGRWQLRVPALPGRTVRARALPAGLSLSQVTVSPAGLVVRCQVAGCRVPLRRVR